MRQITQKKHGRQFSLWRSVFNIAVGVMIFAFGLGVGNGQISLNSRRSVQNNLPENLNYSSVEQVYDLLKLDYDGQLDEDKLLNGLKKGLAEASGDDYTEYLSPEEARELEEDLSGTFTGIGAILGKEDGLITVMSPLPGYPAEKAGLRAQDVIAKINDESTQDMTLSEAVKKIRGAADTIVKLAVIRDEQPLDFDIKREKITIPSVKHEVLAGDIGYMQITQFSPNQSESASTTELARAAASEFKQKGVKRVILDLRGNGGGALEAAVDVAGVWLPKGKTVLTERRDNVVVKTLNSNGPATLAGIPTVVLIDGGSASASEIVAGALKDNEAATLIGVKSYGKGSVQSLDKLLNGGILKVTIGRWFTPGGRNIDKEGIEPDQKVERSDDDFKNNKDPQKDAAIIFLKDK